jgi:uncharacterized protein YcfL
MGTMKQVLILILSAFLLVGCSTDGNDTESPTAGVYIGRSGSVVLSAEIEFNRCTRVTAYKDNQVCSQVAQITTTGQYPDYTYSGDGFNLVCHYTDANSFSAFVSGQMPTLYTGGYTDVSGTFNFTRKDTPLDVNGDGILDSLQSL